jgi:dipeptidyl aminopeptidase/acylaminoacyl peptidase
MKEGFTFLHAIRWENDMKKMLKMESCCIVAFLMTGLFVYSGYAKDAKEARIASTQKVSAPANDETFAEIADRFAYDKEMPLEAQIIGAWPHRIPYVIEKIQYKSTHNERVPGLFVYPKDLNGRRCPAVLLIHGSNDFWGKNENWCMDWIDVLVRSGRCVLVIDNPGYGERKFFTASQPAKKNYRYEYRDNFIQTIVDQRRGIDYLLTRPEVDSGKIGLLGGSRGAYYGSVIAGLDDRLKAVVLTVGWASQDNPKDLYSRCFNNMNFVPRITAPVMMINASEDTIIGHQAAEELFSVIKSPKRMVWYPTGHYIPPKNGNKEILEWFDLYLK